MSEPDDVAAPGTPEPTDTPGQHDRVDAVPAPPTDPGPPAAPDAVTDPAVRPDEADGDAAAPAPTPVAVTAADQPDQAAAAEPLADPVPPAAPAAPAAPVAVEPPAEPAAAAPATPAESAQSTDTGHSGESTDDTGTSSDPATEPQQGSGPAMPAPRPAAPSPVEPRPAPPRPAPPAAPSPAALAAQAATSPHPPTPAPLHTGPPSAGAHAATAFGRVAEDGTVSVRLADGSEQVVGQWAAGEPAAGLEFFARKYDDLAVEVDLAVRRLGEGRAAADQAGAVVKRARQALAEPAMVGDLATLAERVEQLDALVAERRAAATAERAEARAKALAAREKIAVEAESLADSTQWKATGERFKALLEQWKSTPRADRGAEQDLWKRFSHARSMFDKHRRQHFARLDSERSEAKQVKEGLVAEAQELATSKEWGPTAGRYRDLMARWKAAGRAGRADEDRLWAQFRAAQDTFFSARNQTFEVRDSDQRENLEAKLKLLKEAEALDTNDLRGAKTALRSIQERWESIGHVPRADKERLEARLRRVEEALRKGDQEQWRRSNPAARALAEDTVAKFSSALNRLRKDQAAAQAGGDEKKAAELAASISSTEALLAAAERAATEFGG
jgi:hypothetical protein